MGLFSCAKELAIEDTQVYLKSLKENMKAPQLPCEIFDLSCLVAMLSQKPKTITAYVWGILFL